MIENSQKWYILDLSWWLVCFLYSVYVLLAQRDTFGTLNIAQICFLIENSQKWYILDLSWWLVCFLYSVYALLAQRDTFGTLNIAQICFLIENSQKWYILDVTWWLVYFLCSLYVFLAQRDHFWVPECLWFITTLNIAQICFMVGISQHGTFWICNDGWYIFCVLCMVYLTKGDPQMFFPYQNPSAKAAFHQNIPIVIILIFLLQILCYSYSELPGNVEIYFRFFPKNSASIGGVEDDGCASHVLDDLFFFGASK